MGKTWIAVGLVLAIVAGGCAASGPAGKDTAGEKPLTKATVVVCPQCGNHFHIGAGLTDEEMAE